MEDLGDQAFVTRNFYADFIHTPGRLFPPKWYLNLPAGLRAGLETEVLFGQTLFRLVLSVLAIGLLLVLLGLLFRQLIRSFRTVSTDAAGVWMRDSLAWKRVVLVFLVPTTLIFHTAPVGPAFFMHLALIGGLILAITRPHAGGVPSFSGLRANKHFRHD